MTTKSRVVLFADRRSNGRRCTKRFVFLFYLWQRRKRRRKYLKRHWVREIFQNRFQLGEYQTLVKEMHENDQESFSKYFRMTPERFDYLLSLVGPMLSKKFLHRKSISPDERLSVTLRFLATGDSLQTISVSYRLGHITVSRTIPEVCDAFSCGVHHRTT